MFIVSLSVCMFVCLFIPLFISSLSFLHSFVYLFVLCNFTIYFACTCYPITGHLILYTPIACLMTEEEDVAGRL